MNAQSTSTSTDVLLKQSESLFKVKIGESLCAWSFGTLEAALQSIQNSNWYKTAPSQFQIIEYKTMNYERVVYERS